MFEYYKFDGVYVVIQAVLALYVQGMFLHRLQDIRLPSYPGLTTGLVVVSGDDMIHVVSVYDEFALSHSSVVILTLLEWTQRDTSPRSSSTADFETVHEINEKPCYVRRISIFNVDDSLATKVV